MQYCIQSEGTDGPVTPLFTVPEFRQRLLRLDGGGDEQRDDERDEVLYVLRGSGSAIVGLDHVELAPGTAVYVASRTAWSIEAAEGLEVLSVLIRNPLSSSAISPVIPCCWSS